jgi:hypothetical protein
MAVNKALPQKARDQVEEFRAASLDQCMASDATEAGRSHNRSALIRQKTTEYEFEPEKIEGEPEPVLCGSTPQNIGSKGGCGRGGDFQNYDYPSLSGVKKLIVDMRETMSTDDALERTHRTFLSPGFSLGTDEMWERFNKTIGGTLTHGPTDALSKAVAATEEFKKVVDAVRSTINYHISNRAAAKSPIDFTKLNISTGSIPMISYDLTSNPALFTAIGGTQGIELYIKDCSLDLETREYSFTLRVEICDDFGVDESDLDAPGLIAMWILQHRRPTHAPFVNEVIVEETVKDAF